MEQLAVPQGATSTDLELSPIPQCGLIRARSPRPADPGEMPRPACSAKQQIVDPQRRGKLKHNIGRKLIAYAIQRSMWFIP